MTGHFQRKGRSMRFCLPMEGMRGIFRLIINILPSQRINPVLDQGFQSPVRHLLLCGHFQMGVPGAMRGRAGADGDKKRLIMKIQELRLKHFGKFTDKDIRVGDGINILYGG